MSDLIRPPVETHKTPWPSPEADERGGPPSAEAAATPRSERGGILRHRWLLPAGLVALALLWAPLPFGSVTLTGEAALDMAGFLIFALTLALVPHAVPGRATIPAAALAALALFALVQSAPLPLGLVETLSPEHGRLAREAGEVLRPPGPEVTATLSLAPAVSRRTALSFLAAAAWLAAAVFLSRRPARRLWLGALLTAAVFEELYGIRRWMARDLTIWGVSVPDSASRLRGTFVNPDHLATYLLIGLAACFAWAWWGWGRGRRGGALENRVIQVAVPAVLWLVLFVGLAFTGSRAALVAALGGAVVQGVAAVWVDARRVERSGARGGDRRESGETRRRLWRRARRGLLVGVAVAAAGLVAVTWTGHEQGLGRLLGTSAFELSGNVRFAVYRQSLGLWTRFPIFGSGLGTFRDAYPLVQPAEVEGTWVHAHSDPLELLVTGGLVGVALALAGLAGLLHGVLRSLGRGFHGEDRAAALAALGAVAAVAAQELLDFGLTLPANAVTLAVVCGAALGVERRRDRGA